MARLRQPIDKLFCFFVFCFTANHGHPWLALKRAMAGHGPRVMLAQVMLVQETLAQVMLAQVMLAQVMLAQVMLVQDMLWPATSAATFFDFYI